jgi:hypothetical protein
VTVKSSAEATVGDGFWGKRLQAAEQGVVLWNFALLFQKSNFEHSTE